MASIELRPMSLGELLDRTFTLYKSRFWLFATIMLVPYVILLAVNVAGSMIGAAAPRSAGSPATLSGAAVGGFFLGVAVFALIYLATFAAAQAATVFAVSDLYLGRETSARQAYSRVRGKVGRVLLVIIMAGLAVAGGFVLLIIPGIIALCRTAVSVPAAMLENVKARQALSRSFDLTKGHAMRILLVFIFVLVLTWIAAFIFQFPILLALRPLTKQPQAVPVGLAILSHLGEFIAGVLVGPIGTIAFSLIYYDLRVRKEAFDLQLLMAALGPGQAAGTPSPA